MPEKAGKAERVFKLRDGLRIHSLPLVGQSKVPSRYREARIQLECFLALLDRLDVLTRMVKAVCPACIYDERERIKLLCQFAFFEAFLVSAHGSQELCVPVVICRVARVKRD